MLHSPGGVCGFQPLSADTWYCLTFLSAIRLGGVLPYCGFYLNFLMTNDVEYLSIPSSVDSEEKKCTKKFCDSDFKSVFRA